MHLSINNAASSARPWARRFAVLPVVVLVFAGAGCGPAVDDSGPSGDSIRGEPIAAAPAATAVSVPQPPPAARGDAVSTDEMPESGGEPVLVGFDRLAGYDYEAAAAALGTNAPPGSSAIPASVRSLDGREAAIKGFMLPLTLEGGLVTEFLLMRDQSMCCFGVIPRMNDWVNVRMRGRGVKSIMDQPVTVLGVLRVGEVYQNGILSCIYEMSGEELLDALDL